MTPTVLLALIERMSPQELINNIGSLSKAAAMDQPQLKVGLIEQKLDAAKTANRVSAFKAETAIAASNVSGEVKAKARTDCADAQVKGQRFDQRLPTPF